MTKERRREELRERRRLRGDPSLTPEAGRLVGRAGKLVGFQAVSLPWLAGQPPLGQLIYGMLTVGKPRPHQVSWQTFRETRFAETFRRAFRTV